MTLAEPYLICHTHWKTSTHPTACPNNRRCHNEDSNLSCRMTLLSVLQRTLGKKIPTTKSCRLVQLNHLCWARHPTSLDITGAMCGPKRTEPFIALMEIEEVAPAVILGQIYQVSNLKHLDRLCYLGDLTPYSLQHLRFCRALSFDAWHKFQCRWLDSFATTENHRTQRSINAKSSPLV